MTEHHPSHERFACERGVGMLVALLVLLMVSILAGTIARVSEMEMEVAGNYRGMSRAFYAADGAAQATVNEMVVETDRLGRFPTDAELAAITPPDLHSATVTDLTIERVGPEVVEPLQSGFFMGLNAITQEFAVTLTAETVDWPVGRSTVRLGTLVDMIPIFQFAVFYEDDLEILPGPPMTLSGRVHSNADIYLNSGRRLRIDSTLTSAGDIFHGRKDDPNASSGRVEIRAARGRYPQMNGLDSRDPDWVPDSLERWDGNVRSADHGAEPLNLAIADKDNPRRIIEPGLSTDTEDDEDTKLFYRADVRILNGKAYDRNGNELSTIDPDTGKSALRPTVIYDHREGRHMLTLEIDMEKLGRSPAWPANGLVYTGSFEGGAGLPGWDPACPSCWGPSEWESYLPPWQTATTEFGIKVTNGSELAAPSTLVSDNPLYLRGDYNTARKKGASLIADAVTVLSDRWGRMPGMGSTDPDADLAYSVQSLNDRRAGNTVINAAIMLGNTETTVGDYNGGLENVMRFLEKWQGATFRFRGSLIDLWRSRYATGDWRYGSPVYTAPARDWDFDADLLTIANMPPFTPMVFTIRISDWSRE